MRLIAFVLVMNAAWLGASPPDTRTYDQVAGADKKTVVDYFLLCPDLVFDTYLSGHPDQGRDVFLEDGQKAAPSETSANFEFRKALLVPGRDPDRDLDVESVVIDTANAFIHVTGQARKSHQHFQITFVYYERADKSRIPAIQFRNSEFEQESDQFAFYDLRGSSWRRMKNSEILPDFSLKDFPSMADQGSLIAKYSSAEWHVELPQHGTTLAVYPLDAADGDDDYQTLADHWASYALYLAWDKGKAQFLPPVAGIRDKSLLPGKDATALDYYALLPQWAFQDLLAGMDPPKPEAVSGEERTLLKRQSRSPHSRVGKSSPTHVEVDFAGQTSSVTVGVLGTYRGEPLIALDTGGDADSVTLWIVHQATGVMEPLDSLLDGPLDSLKTFDRFYREHVETQNLRLAKTLTADNQIEVTLDTSHWADNPNPDFRFVLKWNGTQFETARQSAR
jgi:hypothetical protein